MKHLKNIQTEVDASYLYQVLADHEADPNIASVFSEMSEIERGHALSFLKKYNYTEKDLPLPSTRAKLLNKIGYFFGYDTILGILLETEKGLSRSILNSKKTTTSTPKSSISDTAHVTILKNILNGSSRLKGTDLARFEKRHRSIGGNALRAAVLGGNDGLVSNFSLIMGIAGASSGQKEVLLAGFAGLLAGALSMALGEWISVKSSQELYENQIQLELEELEANPEGEEQELALIYKSKGIPEDQALAMARTIMSNPNEAQQVLLKEELGINEEDLKGSAMEAAITSFVLFSVGALIPLVPFFFTEGFQAIILSTILSAIGLFLIGSAITLFTGKSIWFSGIRQVVFGLIAAAITFSIGKLIGVSIIG